MSDTVNQSRTFEILTASPVGERRKPRKWPDDEKARLVALCLAPGASVCAIARSVGVDPSQLYDWRRKALSSGVAAPLARPAASPHGFARVEPLPPMTVEVVIGDAVVRVGGGIDARDLALVLRAVRNA
jgi:transposase